MQMSLACLGDRVKGWAPVIFWVVHHNVEEGRHHIAKDRGTIAHLVSVDTAVPRCTAMYQLIAQNIQSIKND